MNCFKEFFCCSFDFVGVVARRNFWMTILVVFLFNLLLTLLGFVLEYVFIAEFVFAIVTLIPSLSLVARRLHDTDRSAWNLCWLFFPFVGVVVLAVYCAEKTKYVI